MTYFDAKSRTVTDNHEVKWVDLTSEELDTLRDDLAWLGIQEQEVNHLDKGTVVKHFSAALREFGRLASLSLDIRVYQDRRIKLDSNTKARYWYPRFVQASRSFAITTEAVATSGIELNSLSLF